ncbi:hypothetical protein LPC08_02030 [Roseomonas sp. OT10]|uniref:hypothetical protein n=1 Tax=Roseomonas cutis TaxID=2897332 RepID=UPI001E600869|nr:hypothetical protein [Roseomonas sp. OT10]UFN49447.1 hypothetical protein LPC08_02030 [Roseomonas sp. OT10]
MLCGEGVVAIWNGVAPEGRAEVDAWHVLEHVPERVGIPGFRRGRRYAAWDAATRPANFTLYEADTLQVLQGRDYRERLDAPTPWTRRATAHFRDTSRAVARVLHSEGPGMGGIALTLRFDAEDSAREGLTALLREAARAPRVTGAHLAAADAEASGTVTREQEGRSDIGAPPRWFVLVEALDAAALEALLPDQALAAAGARGPFSRGVYRLEYLRTTTAWSP